MSFCINGLSSGSAVGGMLLSPAMLPLRADGWRLWLQAERCNFPGSFWDVLFQALTHLPPSSESVLDSMSLNHLGFGTAVIKLEGFLAIGRRRQRNNECFTCFIKHK